MSGLSLVDIAAKTLWAVAAGLVVLAFIAPGRPGLVAVRISSVCLISWFVLTEVVLTVKRERRGFITRFVVTLAALMFLAVIGPVIAAAGH